MKDERKTKEQLISELEDLRKRVARFEASEARRKQTEKALGANEEKFRTLIHNIPGMVYRGRPDWTVEIIANSDIICGYSGKEFRSGEAHWPDLIHKEDRGRVFEEASQIEKKPERLIQEYRIIHKDGKTRWVKDQKISQFIDGKFIGVNGIVYDITECKQAEERLRESEQKYRSLFENANDAIFIADTKTGIILDANKQAEKLTGRPKDEIIGIHQSKLHPSHLAQHYKDKFCEHVQEGHIFDLEAEVIKKDRRVVPVLISASVISLGGKRVIQGIFRDITYEKRILELKEEIEVRKLIEKAKGILMDHHMVSEKEAMRRLQRESRRQSKKIKEIAQAIISSELILN
jgi:PAS domain S-box-containing protein